ncbi:MAG TPA: DNA primase [Longimicrobiales bacterium]
MIPDTIIDELRERADIVEVVGEYVPLKKKGKDYWANCPFHKENTPSFHVVPSRGFYKCFGCGESGDVFSFLMKYAGLSFHDAAHQLAGRLGIEIPDVAPRRPEEEPHRRLYEAAAFAAEFFAERLWSPAGQRARAYLARRGIAEEVARRFHLGYAPDEWHALREAAARHGIDDDVLLEAGLVKTSERREGPYDRFRDRLIFPITDPGGRIIAFGGRVLGAAREGAPKYLNSPETPIYHKGYHLYGIAWAKAAIRRESVALVVEGYMDYVSLAAHGVENVVAGLGTAMTAEQAALLARYTRQALLLYDSDAAGLRATFRAADALLAANVHPLIVTLPPGEDPDSLARSGGARALRPFLDAAVDVLDRKLQILDARGYFEGAEGTRKALDGLLPTLRAVVDPALRDIYVARVAERTGVRRETLEAELRAAPAMRPRPPARISPAERQRTPAPAGITGQKKLIQLLLRDESRIPKAAEALRPGDLADASCRAIFEALVREGGLRGRSPDALGLAGAALDTLQALLGDPEELGDGDRVFEELVGDLRAQSLFERKDALKKKLGEKGADPLGILRELTEVNNALQALGSELKRLGFKLSARYRRYLRART